jgi:hypothetical protein
MLFATAHDQDQPVILAKVLRDIWPTNLLE